MSDDEKKITRRDFIKGASLGSLSSIIALTTGSLLGNAIAQDKTSATPTPAPEKPDMPMRPFGKTGVKVSILSLGGIIDFTANQIILKKSIDWGINYWDTAASYIGGNSEIGIGQFFEKFPEARKKIFLITKSGTRDPEGLSKSLKTSLERMKTDYIDLYFIHGLEDANELSPEVKAWAEKMKKEGKIKFFGFSAHRNMAQFLQHASSLGWVDGIMMTYNYRIMHKDDMKMAVEACHKAGIGLTAMKSQGGGPVKTDSEAELKLAGRFIQKGFSPQQAKIKAIWENSAITSVCSAMYNLSTLQANVAAAVDKTKLELSDLNALRTYAESTCNGYCAGCVSLCNGAMGGDIHIADVMRYMMYYRTYGEPELARGHFSMLPETVRARMASLDYSPAERVCPQGLAIGEIMRDAARLLA